MALFAITANLTANSLNVSNATGSISYSGLANLNLNLGGGNNAINVTSDSATTNTTITAGNGNNTFTVVPSTQPYALRRALLTLMAAEPWARNPGGNSLIINDSGDPVARSVVVTPTNITGLGGPIFWANWQT